jgi:hypothetical protein
VLASSALNSYKKTISGHSGNNHNHENRISRIDASSVISSQSHAFPRASILPSPTPNTNREYLSESSFVGSLAGTGTLDDWIVDDFILVSTVDGSLHALDRKTGLELWSIPGEKPLVEVSTAEYLINISNSRTPGSPPCEDCDLIWITEPIGEGTLYFFKPENGLQKLTVSFKELVQTPYAFDKEHKMITGSHHTTLYSIESKTGKILKVYGSENLASACPPQINPFYFEEDEDIDDLEEESSKINHSFKIGRTGNYMIFFSFKNFIFTNVQFSRVQAPNLWKRRSSLEYYVHYLGS